MNNLGRERFATSLLLLLSLAARAQDLEVIGGDPRTVKRPVTVIAEFTELSLPFRLTAPGGYGYYDWRGSRDLELTPDSEALNECQVDLWRSSGTTSQSLLWVRVNALRIDDGRLTVQPFPRNGPYEFLPRNGNGGGDDDDDDDDDDGGEIDFARIAQLAQQLAGTMNEASVAAVLANQIAKVLDSPVQTLDQLRLEYQSAVQRAFRTARPEKDWLQGFRVPLSQEIEQLGITTAADYRKVIQAIVSGLRRVASLNDRHITMLTLRPPIVCEPCERWWNTERPHLLQAGYLVDKRYTDGVAPSFVLSVQGRTYTAQGYHSYATIASKFGSIQWQR